MTFRPERMENGYPEQHFPFGFGNRTCIGKRLAYVEGVYLLAFLVKNFRLKISETSPVPTSRVTLTHHADEGLHDTVWEIATATPWVPHRGGTTFSSLSLAVHLKRRGLPTQEEVTRVIGSSNTCFGLWTVAGLFRLLGLCHPPSPQSRFMLVDQENIYDVYS